MEEEIPQALDLLKNIPKLLKEHFPGLSYPKFVIYMVFRIVMGYLFLLDLFIVTVQATDVLEIFFNILALEFVKKIDDVTFLLAKISVFVHRLKQATTQ